MNDKRNCVTSNNAEKVENDLADFFPQMKNFFERSYPQCPYHYYIIDSNLEVLNIVSEHQVNQRFSFDYIAEEFVKNPKSDSFYHDSMIYVDDCHLSEFDDGWFPCNNNDMLLTLTDFIRVRRKKKQDRIKLRNYFENCEDNFFCMLYDRHSKEEMKEFHEKFRWYNFLLGP